MKQPLSQVGFRIRALRESRQQSQESLATECQQYGFAITRQKLAHYELGLNDVPARFIPVFAHVLRANIADLLPAIAGKAESEPTSGLLKIRNLTGQQIKTLRKKQKWSQSKLAEVLRQMGVPMTREIIANLETRRTRVKDYQLVILAKALQTPMDSLFSNGSNVIGSPSNHSSNNRGDKTNLIQKPLARVIHGISEYANRFLRW